MCLDVFQKEYKSQVGLTSDFYSSISFLLSIQLVSISFKLHQNKSNLTAMGLFAVMHVHCSSIIVSLESKSKSLSF